MIHDVHSAVRTLFAKPGGFDPVEVELFFEPPLKERVNALLRPAVCFFLLGMQENTELRQTYRQTVRGEDGAVHRMPPRRFDLRYLVTAFATDVADEQTLLWRTLLLLLQHPNLPAETLPESMRVVDLPVSTRILPEGEGGIRPLDYWNALGLPPRPGLIYAVTVPVDLEFTLRSPLVLTRTLRIRDDPAAERHHIGGTVRGPDGIAVAGVRIDVEGRGFADPIVSDGQGRFVLANLPAGEVTLRITRTKSKHQEQGSEDSVTQTVTLPLPAERYDILIDE